MKDAMSRIGERTACVTETGSIAREGAAGMHCPLTHRISKVLVSAVTGMRSRFVGVLFG